MDTYGAAVWFALATHLKSRINAAEYIKVFCHADEFSVEQNIIFQKVLQIGQHADLNGYVDIQAKASPLKVIDDSDEPIFTFTFNA